MYKIKLCRYKAAIVFVVKCMNEKSFNGTSLRGAFNENHDMDLVRFILGSGTPSKFLTSSKVNINYVTIFKDGMNTIPDSLYRIIYRSQLEFDHDGLYMVVGEKKDADMFNTAMQMKAINTMLYDGKKSIVNTIINKMIDQGYLSQVVESRLKANFNDTFVEGSTGIATRQYVFSATKDYENLETLLADRSYINFNDVVKDDGVLEKSTVVKNILLKLGQNAIIRKSIEHDIVNITEHQSMIEKKIEKYLYNNKG